MSRLRTFFLNNAHWVSPSPGLKQILQAYHRAPPGVRIRIVIRFFTCPYASILPYLPNQGRILDIGCGDGLFLYLAAQRKGKGVGESLGIDHDEKKIAVAKNLENDLLKFRAGEVSVLPSERYDCITLIDVLCCIRIDHWRSFLRECLRVLRPGGRLVIKEVAKTPAWKYWLTYAQEILSIRVLKMTRGDRPHIETVGTHRAAIQQAGVERIQTIRVDALMPHSHFILIGQKPGPRSM